MKPELLTNRPGEVVADGIRGYLEHLRETLKDPCELAIATAYFNLGGWQLVADELDHPKTVRLLLGAEPPDPERRVRKLDEVHDRSERQQVRRALEGHDRDLQAEADLLGFTMEAAKGAGRLIEWLRSEQVQVKRLPDRFLHGKAWIVSDNADGAVVGSANFEEDGVLSRLNCRRDDARQFKQPRRHLVRRSSFDSHLVRILVDKRANDTKVPSGQ